MGTEPRVCVQHWKNLLSSLVIEMLSTSFHAQFHAYINGSALKGISPGFFVAETQAMLQVQSEILNQLYDRQYLSKMTLSIMYSRTPGFTKSNQPTTRVCRDVKLWPQHGESLCSWVANLLTMASAPECLSIGDFKVQQGILQFNNMVFS